jgi:HEAT repeat protein
MLAFCPTCWNEITDSPRVCRKCGTKVDIHSPEYQQKLLDLIPSSNATKRAEICLLLGRREMRNVVPALVSLACSDPDAIVRVAALRALDEIGDAPALHTIAKVAANEKSPVHAVAKQILTGHQSRAGSR